MKLYINEEHKDIRIDSAIAQLTLAHDPISRSQVKKLTKLEKVLVNGKPVKSSYITADGDMVEILTEGIAGDSLKPVNQPIDIIFEDAHILVLNKPEGLTVHPTDTSDQITLVNVLLFHYPSIKDVGDDVLRPGIVHRLDKLTSGVMVVAKDQATFNSLKEVWKEGLVQKLYYALVWGDIDTAGSISGKISRSKRTGRMVTRKTTEDEGRDSVTLYNPIGHFTTATLVEIATHTGRTHQIRTHFKSIGQPILGDPLYAYKKQKNTFPRLFLHAHSLTFPYKGERLTFAADLPETFTRFLDSLKKKS